MRKKLLIISLFTLMLMMFSLQCNDTQPIPQPEPPPKHTGPLYNVGMWIPVGERSATPDWLDQEGGITDVGGTKYMWLKGEGDSVDRTVAMRTARGDAQSRLAESLKLIVNSQYAQAWDALGIGQDESVEKVKQGVIATKTTVTVSDFRVLETHKQQMAQLVKLPQGDPKASDLGKVNIWRYTVKMAIPYSEYKRLREELMSKVKEQAVANERQKALIDKADKALQDIDRDPKEVSVKSTTPKNPA